MHITARMLSQSRFTERLLLTQCHEDPQDQRTISTRILVSTVNSASGHCTVTVTSVLCMTEPEVAFTVTVYIPARVPPDPSELLELLPPPQAICRPRTSMNIVMSEAARMVFFVF